MLHPSYTDLMDIVNSNVENGEQPVVNSRYSIVMATAKRARQIIDGKEPLVYAKCNKPFSIAVEEVYRKKVQVLNDEEAQEYKEKEEEAKHQKQLAEEETARRLREAALEAEQAQLEAEAADEEELFEVSEDVEDVEAEGVADADASDAEE